MTFSAESIPDLGRQLRREAIVASLREEAELQEQIVASARSFIELIEPTWNLLGSNDYADAAAATLEKWNRRPDVPILRAVRPYIEAGHQPVFATVSLRISSGGPTVYIPVPYSVGKASVQALLRHVALTGANQDEANSSVETTCARDLARTVSHAMLNISYSVRLDDTPPKGWLAAAHEKRAAIYIRDVRQIEQSDAVSVAHDSEDYLGIASVLYLPICGNPTAPDDQSPASAVLMLWSPVVGRWDGVVSPMPSAQPKIRPPDDVRAALWNEFRWILTVTRRDETGQRRAELEVLGFLLAMQSWSERHGSNFLANFQTHFQESLRLLKELQTGTPSQVAVEEWVGDLLASSLGFYNYLKKAAKEAPDFVYADATVKLILEGKEKLEMNLRQAERCHRDIIKQIPNGLCAGLSRDTARYFASEPVTNLVRYAEALHRIEIDIWPKRATIRYIERPKAHDRARLIGELDRPSMLEGEDGFSTYFAIRRGLLAPPRTSVGGGLGLGLWLYRIFAARMNVFRKLYISVGGDFCHTEISLPVFDRRCA